MWNIATTDTFDEWFVELPSTEQSEVIAKVELLKLRGLNLGRPHADTLSGSKYRNLKELRADTQNQIMRIVFAFDPKRTAILLVAGNKQGISSRQFYKRLIAKAEELYEAHLASLKGLK